MAELKFIVDGSRCTRCGACVRDCPSYVICMNDGLPSIPADKSDSCIQCQHCLAVCPTAAVSIFGLDPKNSLPVSPEKLPTLGQADTLVRGRRSVRAYRDENVDASLINRLLAAMAHAPTGCNNRQLTFTVIDDKASLAKLRDTTLASLAAVRGVAKIPDRIAFIWDAIDAYRDHKVDEIFRGAPHALIVSARPDAPCGAEDVAIALSNFELLARCAGLGTVWCGLLKIAMEVCPNLKDVVGLPQGVPYYAMLFGWPGVHYPRTVQRDAAATIKRVSI